MDRRCWVFCTSSWLDPGVRGWKRTVVARILRIGCPQAGQALYILFARTGGSGGGEGGSPLRVLGYRAGLGGGEVGLLEALFLLVSSLSLIAALEQRIRKNRGLSFYGLF